MCQGVFLFQNPFFKAKKGNAFFIYLVELAQEKGSAVLMAEFNYYHQASVQSRRFQLLRFSQISLLEVKNLQSYLLQKYRPWKEKLDTAIER